MCGIVASVQKPTENVNKYLIKGLHALEYRGYDSSGLAVINKSKLTQVRVKGRVKELEKNTKKLIGNIGIGHTRWATHGEPSLRNSHPLVVKSKKGKVAVVHNGIIENYAKLKKELIAKKCKFTSDTDTEVIAHLISLEINKGASLFAAIQRVVKKLSGAFAIAAITSNEADKIVCVRHASPILLAKGKNGMYLASDAQAFAGVSQELIWLENDDCAEISQSCYRVVNGEGKVVNRRINHVDNIGSATVELGAYRHFMEKEIYEQPDAVAATIAPFYEQDFDPKLFGKNAKSILTKVDSIVLLACGTSYHISLVAAKWFEEIAKVKVSVHLASEFRDRISRDVENALVIGVSQSGETADVLAVFKEIKKIKNKKPAPLSTLAISNVAISSLVHECELSFITRAGPEIGVASTKTFLTQGVALLNLAIIIARLKSTISKKQDKELIQSIHNLPFTLRNIFDLKEEVKKWANAICQSKHCLFLGRGIHLPIALEGALKLKEISYIHAEGYPAGELKHGPLALVDRDMPVIALVPDNEILAKIETNVNEVASREGKLYVVAGNKFQVKGAKVIRIKDDGSKLLSPLIYTIPLQLLAYYTARIIGTDIDKPRNLAKSVTVD